MSSSALRNLSAPAARFGASILNNSGLFRGRDSGLQRLKLTKAPIEQRSEVVDTLSKRERAVLSAVVTEFTATGEPVSSRTLARKYGFDLSPATIRNVLSDLEDRGYLTQPHASAGRTPTEPAFRLFIDALMRLRQVSEPDASKIAGWFGELPPGSDLLRGAGKLLSDLTGAAAIMLRSRVPERTLQAIRFMRTRPHELLGVLVFQDGTVENRFIAVDSPPSERELERVHNVLAGAVDGKTLSSVRDYFARSVNEHRDELHHLKTMGASLLTAAIDASGRDCEVLIEGQSRLLERPEFRDSDRLRELLRALEEREKLVGLLDSIIETRRVQVFLGGETEERVGYPVSLVAAPYQEDGRPGGALGVIGPLSMDYPTIIPFVLATADAMSAALAKPPR